MRLRSRCRSGPMQDCKGAVCPDSRPDAMESCKDALCLAFKMKLCDRFVKRNGSQRPSFIARNNKIQPSRGCSVGVCRCSKGSIRTSYWTTEDEHPLTSLHRANAVDVLVRTAFQQSLMGGTPCNLPSPVVEFAFACLKRLPTSNATMT